jgi:uncharacterized protein (DUF169 family)
MAGQNEDYPMHKDKETLVRYYDRVDQFFKHPQVDGTGLVVGTLAGIDGPDVVMLFLTPHQADILNRIRAYFGDYTKGFGGMGGCIFTIRYAFVADDPCFSTSDTAWRMFAGLAETELTYSFPYKKLLDIASRIKPTVEYVEGFRSMF